MKTEETIRASLAESFAFLRSKGFRISSFEYHQESFGDWYMFFESGKSLLAVKRERNGDIDIAFKPRNTTEKRWFAIGTLVFFLSNGKEYIGIFEGE